MLDQQINEQLGLLQKELNRLKKVTDYIDNAKENSVSIIVELEKVQKNYSVYTEKIFGLYKQYINDIKQNTEIQINEGVLKFETTGNKIDSTNKEKLIEIKRLLEQYKQIVEATDNLVKVIESVDFPVRLARVDKEIDSLNTLRCKGQESIENTLSLNQSIIIKKFEEQNKQIKIMKVVLFVVLGILSFAITATILALKFSSVMHFFK
jgi:hypothetical protein